MSVPTMNFDIENARLTDVDELLKLYFTVYGKDYPVLYGTDPEVMASAIESKEHVWLIGRERKSRRIAGSVIFEVDLVHRVAKIVALVTHPDFRKQNLATALVQAQTNKLLSDVDGVDSVYTTTRTVSPGVQIIFLHSGFLALGIFPNAHKLREYETTTLFAKFRPGVLESRSRLVPVPAKLSKLYEVFHAQLDRAGIPHGVAQAQVPALAPQSAQRSVSRTPVEDFEIIFAEEFVKRRFNESSADPYDRFFPFHKPNMIVVSKSGDFEVYLHFSKSDHYCAILTLSHAIHEVCDRFPSLLSALRDYGVSYVELLIGIQYQKSIEALLLQDFLPSALYPALLKIEGKTEDFVVMSRSMEPLNFQGMMIDQSFKPYVDQYIELWKKMHLDTLEIFNDYE